MAVCLTYCPAKCTVTNSLHLITLFAMHVLLEKLRECNNEAFQVTNAWCLPCPVSYCPPRLCQFSHD